MSLSRPSKAEVAKVTADHEWWKAIAAKLGAETLGFSGRYAATFSWPDSTTSEIRGGLLKSLIAIEAQEAERQQLTDLLATSDALVIGPNGAGGSKITIDFSDYRDAGKLFELLSDISCAALSPVLIEDGEVGK